MNMKKIECKKYDASIDKKDFSVFYQLNCKKFNCSDCPQSPQKSTLKTLRKKRQKDFKKVFRDGIFKYERTVISAKDINTLKGQKAIKESLNSFTSENILKTYETQARDILKRESYPTEFNRLWKLIIEKRNKKEFIPAIIEDVNRLFLRIEDLKERLKENGNTESIFMATHLLEEVATKIKLRPLEPELQYIRPGKKAIEGGRKGIKIKSQETKEKHEPVLKRAKEIKQKHPSCSYNYIVSIIKGEGITNLKERQIHNIIRGI